MSQGQTQRITRRLSGSALGLALLASLTGQGLLVVSGIVSARLLGPDGRGEFALFAASAALGATVLSLGRPQALTYFVARSPPRAATLALRAILLDTGVFGAAGLTLVVGAKILFRVDPTVSAPVVLVAYSTSVAWTAYSLALGLQRHVAFNAIRQTPAAVFTVVLIVAVVASDPDLRGVTVIYALSYVVGASVGLAYVVALALEARRTRVRQDGAGVRDILGYGARSFLGSVSPIESFRLDQFVVFFTAGSGALGLYAVGQSFTNLPRFISQSVGLVASPEVASQDQDAATRTRLRRTRQNRVLTGPLILLLALAAPFLIPILFGRDFSDAVIPAMLLLLAVYAWGYRRLQLDVVRSSGGGGRASLVELGTAATYLLAAIPASLAFGATGAAGALACVYAMSALAIGHSLAEQTR